MTEIFRSDNLVVRMRAPHGSTRLIVSFAPWRTTPDLEHIGFGADFLAGHRLDAIHVTCVGNDWYQYPEMAEAYAAIRAAGANHQSLITYGVSMGGYQAIKAAEPLGARRALAISPQISVDPRKVPFETRWPEANDLTFIDDDIVKGSARYVLVYDPRSPFDAAHARLLIRALGRRNLLLAPMPFAGHAVLRTWKEAGIVSKATLTLLKSKGDTGGVRGLFRQMRRASPHYMGGLILTGRLTPATRAVVQAQLTALKAEG